MTSERPILCKLKGPVADSLNATRNGRKYSAKLWERALNQDLVKESFENGGLLLELGHPADRIEVDFEKVAGVMPKPPVKQPDGKYQAEVDIIDTPNGRIAATLAKYGYKLGISSRGEGELSIDMDGNECVDPDTYELTTWDLVVIPAVAEARLSLVTEGIDTNKKNLRKALLEAINTANDSDKQMMLETLDRIDIKLDIENKDDIDKEEAIEDSESSEHDAVVDNQVDLFNELKEALTKNHLLEEEQQRLQEKLSVCYAKDLKTEEQLVQYKESIQALVNENKKLRTLEATISKLTENVSRKDEQIQSLTKHIEELEADSKKALHEHKSLNETLAIKNSKISKLENMVEQLQKSTLDKETLHVSEVSRLTEQVEELSKNLQVKRNEYSTKLKKANESVDKYKNIAKRAVDKYIESKAWNLGISANEIKNRLCENYSFNDIDHVCEELRDYKLNINSLPFKISENNVVKVKAIKSMNEAIIPTNSLIDDEIDPQLARISGLQ